MNKKLVFFTENKEYKNEFISHQKDINDYDVEYIDGNFYTAIDYIEAHIEINTIIIDIDAINDDIEELDKLANVCPEEITVIAYGSNNTIHHYHQLKNLGIYEYFAKPLNTEHILHSLGTITNSQDLQINKITQSTPHQNIACIGVNGGVGATTIAFSVANVIANTNNKDCIFVDLDLDFSSLLFNLGLNNTTKIQDIQNNSHKLDKTYLNQITEKYGSNLKILSQDIELNYNHKTEIRSDFIEKIVENFEFSIFDLHRTTFIQNPELIENFKTIVLISDMSINGLSATTKIINFIKEQTKDIEIKIIINSIIPEKYSNIKLENFNKLYNTEIVTHIKYCPELQNLLLENKIILKNTSIHKNIVKNINKIISIEKNTDKKNKWWRS